MNLAEPAGRSSPALAEAAEPVKSVRNDDEYIVEDAVGSSEQLNVAPAERVGAAVTVDDPKKFAPIKQLEEPHRNDPSDLNPDKLLSTGEADFVGEVAVSKGMKKTLGRTLCPCCFDPREFVTYSEIKRYIVVKDNNIFVYVQETDHNPLYNIPLGNLKPEKEDPSNPHKSSITISPGYNTNLQGVDYDTIILLDGMDNFAYQFTFDITRDKDSCDRFMLAVQNINFVTKSTEKSSPPKTVS
jgi:hypothetical protein